MLLIKYKKEPVFSSIHSQYLKAVDVVIGILLSAEERPKAKCFLALKSSREKLSSRTNSITEIPNVRMQLTK